MEHGRLLLFVITALLIFCLTDANYTVDAMDESSFVQFQNRHDQEWLVQILSTMGFTSLASHFQSSQELLVGWKGPLTLFVPTEEAFTNFNSLNSYFSSNSSSDYLLSHHIARGLFTYAHLKMLPYGTKLDTIASGGRQLVVTFNSRADVQDLIYSSTKTRIEYSPVYVNGVLVSHPDIFNDGLISIHGVDKLLLVLESSKSRSHGIYYSPHSADPPTPATAIRMPPFSSASSGPDNPMNNIMPFMLESAARGLRDRRYRTLALAMCKTLELLHLKKITIFTLSDDSVFLKGGLDFKNNLRYHVVPNRRHLFADLVCLSVGTRLHTLLYGQSLVVTDKG